MLITSLKIVRLDKSKNPLKGVASITLDDMIVIHDIKVLYTTSRKLLGMPSKVLPNNDFRDIVHPISKIVRDVLEKLVLDAYQKCEKEGKQYMCFVIRDDFKSSSFEELKFDYYAVKENDIVDVRRKKDDVQSHVENRKNARQDDTILNWLKL